MERELSNSLPEHLVDNIVARIPFPSIFKARCLSKSWRARFSSPASQEDETKKRVAMSFQNLVLENSRRWKIFCPVFISKPGDLVACDMENRHWQTLPSISFLPESVRKKNLNSEGAFLYTTCNRRDGSVVVANIITQAFKILTPPHDEDLLSYRYSNVDRFLQTYKLIVLGVARSSIKYSVQIYDSKTKAWSKFVDTVSGRRGFAKNGDKFSSIFLNEVLYLASGTVPKHLWVLNLKEETIKEQDVLSPYRPDQFRVSSCDVVSDNTNLFMVVRYYGQFREILKIDGESLNVVDSFRLRDPMPHGADSTSLFTTEVSDGCHIYFSSRRQYYMRPTVLPYNVKDRFWNGRIESPIVDARHDGYVHIVSFQPGLCPFLWEF
jgi:hypothetical protein